MDFHAHGRAEGSWGIARSIVTKQSLSNARETGEIAALPLVARNDDVTMSKAFAIVDSEP